MIVKDIAEFDVKFCTPDTDLARAAKIMWACDCGAGASRSSMNRKGWQESSR